MKEILFLCHRIPYPPNKGDKIRAYHQLRALAERYTVHLGTFIDDRADWQHCGTLDKLCGETCYRPLPPLRARIRSVAGLVTGEPLSFPYYRDRKLQQWVDRIMRQRSIVVVVVFSSTMATYAQRHDGVRRVLDFVDVDSEKWRQYAPTIKVPMRWIYAREGHKLLAAERKLASSFDASVFVSEAEANLFRQRAPESAEHVMAIPNGVDSAYFDPDREYLDPYDGSGRHTLVFTGAMDYRANIDAVTWFAHEVLPLIRKERPNARFCIVGAHPARAVLDLAQRPGVEVTGTVDDVRPYLAHAACAVAPLRIARGLQNKVLEALAMGKRVVMTPEAATGLKTPEPAFAAIESVPAALAQNAIRFMPRNLPCHLVGQVQSHSARDEEEDEETTVDISARSYVLQNYSWDNQLTRFLALVDGAQAVPGKTLSQVEALAGDSA